MIRKGVLRYDDDFIWDAMFNISLLVSLNGIDAGFCRIFLYGDELFYI
jgi:hypothetical protein